MKNIYDQKKALRANVKALKNAHSREELIQFSTQVTASLEQLDLFRKANTVMLYHSLPDEVHTLHLIQKYHAEKQIVLPVIVSDKLVLKEYHANEPMNLSSYGIWEPTGADFTDFKSISLIIVPGVAFDHHCNRMGRGKAYYDRLLPRLEYANKVGVCFDFQLFPTLPADENDVKMDMVISQTHLIDLQNSYQKA